MARTYTRLDLATSAHTLAGFERNLLEAQVDLAQALERVAALRSEVAEHLHAYREVRAIDATMRALDRHERMEEREERARERAEAARAERHVLEWPARTRTVGSSALTEVRAV